MSQQDFSKSLIFAVSGVKKKLRDVYLLTISYKYFAKNVVSSGIEAAIVLLVTQLPLLLGLILHVMDNEGATFSIETAVSIFGATFTPGDVLSYVAGILGSSMAFFVVNLRGFRRRPGMMLFLIISPILILFLAAPVYIQDGDGQAGNVEFVSTYVIVLIFCSVIVWLISLYQSRVMFDIDYSGNGASKKIIDDLEAAK